MNAEATIISLLRNLLDVNMDDTRASVCVNNAISAIKQYVNKVYPDDEFLETFMFQIAKLAHHYYKSFDDGNIKSKSQGGRSVTYKDNYDIPDEIKKSLPRYAKPF